MTSGFHPSELLKSISNYPDAKGDLPGHEFHGNQYADAPMSSSNEVIAGAKTIGEASHQLDDHVRYGDMSLRFEGGGWTSHGYDSPDISGNFLHEPAAEAHEEIARALDKVGTPEAQSAAQAHRDAAEGHLAAHGASEEAYDEDTADDYQRAAYEAQSLTDDANKLTTGK